ncbi:AI-2E family transporter [Leucobacter sp. OH1287]|uniref:AI-2E family transporter n=1 Tax=Leucobacter sp. OH1287 TaxID=2491049 RepID=UPI001F22A80C|nr:AI-2E family transporter [Leucobacter sp. OH1287]
MNNREHSNQDSAPQTVGRALGAGKDHETELPRDAAVYLPLGVRVAAAWSWRLLLICAASAVLIWGIVQLRVIVIPVLVAILLAALLQPIVDLTVKKLRLPRVIGVLLALVTLFVAVGVLVWLIVTQFMSGLNGISDRIAYVWNEALDWLHSKPFGIDLSDYTVGWNDVLKAVETHQARLWSGALGVASGVGQFVAGAILAIFSLIFMLLDGRRIWYWVLGFLPSRAHAPLDVAAKAGWVSVGQYVRVQILVAFVDAVGIWLGAIILQVPLATPIAIMVFLGSFIPFLGAITTGAIACLVALVYNGPLTAVLMLLVVLIVNQLEGNILQPLVMGNAVKVHPLGVVIAVSTGAILAGIPGALFAVPIAASANSMVNSLVDGKWRGMEDPLKKYHAQRRNRLTARGRLRSLKRALRKETR